MRVERNAQGTERRPLVGMGVLVTRGNLVLLGRRKGAHGAGYYAAPGGHIEWGESLADTARREVREECGLEIEAIRLLSVGSYLWGDDRHFVDVDVVCEAPHGEPRNLEPDRCEGWDWYPLDRLPSPLFVVTENMLASLRSGAIAADLETIYRQPPLG
ncbi:MAG: nucleotide triphosphate diphosphatase NUDT15 [Anaerolineae bacterium]|jgi:8-oxo-dGTP diphosphatase